LSERFIAGFDRMESQLERSMARLDAGKTMTWEETGYSGHADAEPSPSAQGLAHSGGGGLAHALGNRVVERMASLDWRQAARPAVQRLAFSTSW
jgi:hypothetical protein